MKFPAVKNAMLNECHAVAYDRAGLEADDDVYDKIAEEVCLDYTGALRSVAVKNEPNPVKLKWNC